MVLCEIVLKPKKELSIHNVKATVLFVSYELMRKKQLNVGLIIHHAQYGICNLRDESNNWLALMIKKRGEESHGISRENYSDPQ